MNLGFRIGFIGVGAMGESVVAGILRSERFSREDISIVGNSEKRTICIAERYEVQRHRSTVELAANCDVICLCVKPKDLKSVGDELKRADLKGKMIVSTLAGVTGQVLHETFPDAFIVRSIPNIASKICEGVTLWTACADTPKRHLEFVRSFWSAVGRSIEVESESYIDLASPISGAAPAFMGIFVEALVDSGVFIGLPRELSTQLVLQSLMGSGGLISDADGNAQLVRQRVTSPGGLTAVCMAQLEAAGFRNAIMNAVVAGKEKTEQLGLLRAVV